MRILKWIDQQLKTNKIRSQLILSIAIIHLVLMSIFVFDMVERQRHFLLQQSKEQALSVANELAVNASTYVMSNDLDGLERLIQSHSNFPNLRYSMIMSPQGVVLAHTDAKYVGKVPIDSVSHTLNMSKAPQTLLENKEFLDIAVPILSKNKTIGFARIGFSKKTINEAIIVVRNNGLWYILLALLIGMAIAIIMGHRISMGLYKLITTAEKIRLGNRAMRVESMRSFELQKLGTAFNEMLDEISANENLLKNVLENLPVGVWILDKKGQFRSVNAAGKKLWGGEDYEGLDKLEEYKGWFTNSGQRVENHEWAPSIALREDRPVLEQEVEIETLDKLRKIILISAIPLHDKNGNLDGLIAINVDITQRKLAENALKQTNRSIGERIKELNGLYHISELSHNKDKTIEEILNDGVAIVPPAYQYPEITCARVTYQGKHYLSPGIFKETKWRQTADIKQASTIVGKIEVFYLQEMPQEDEGPFLKEERLLINSFADILGGALERNKTELAVREAELKFRNLVEKSLVGVYITQDGKFVYVNPQIIKDSGFSEKELLGKSIFDLVVPEDWPIIKSNVEKRNRSKTGTSQYEVKTKTKDGKIIWVEVFGSTTLYNGAPAMIGTMVNITERKRVYDELKKSEANLQKQAGELAISNADLEQSEKRYSELFNFSPLPAWVADVKTLKFLDVNNAAVLHYGYSREEFLSMSLKDIRPTQEMEQMHTAIADHLNQKDGIFRTVMVHKKKNGELMDVDIQVVPIHYTGLKANLAIATDITDRLNYINAIEAQNKRLLEISWIQSHIARAPLSKIMALIPLLEDENETVAEKKKILSYILTSVYELDEIIKSITDKSKIEDFKSLKSDDEKFK